ncbi:hypothetical protein BDN67DRAFT_915439 [Paxillus ammoniavirescens]|nr:hypothetical protein BDN67DRAFT_915439 [Paxillus ammoniavirescens]
MSEGQLQISHLYKLINIVAKIEGELFDVFGHEAKEEVHVALPFASMDTPARLKSAGFLSQNSDDFMCPGCKAPFCSLVDSSCFDHAQFDYHDPKKQLKWKFVYGDSDELDIRDAIAENKGVRMSILDQLPTWNGALSIPPEIMHMFWGSGMMLLLLVNMILLDGSMFTSTRKQSEETPMDCLVEFAKSIWWPSNSGRFQLKMVTGGGRPKADEWCNFMRIYPVALAVAWDMWTCPIDAQAPDPKKNSKVQKAVLSRNYHSHYQNVLRFCASTRIFASRSITPHEASRASDFMSEVSQSWAAMNCHLTPNSHFACHLPEYINAYGPAYAWWVFPYERAIGLLGRANHNSHGSGEIETTFMRSWWKSILSQDLVCFFFFFQCYI